ncbi:hypothetical protein GCM10023085_31420 [Actinomadura viridis]|uniref:CDP-glycerol glycerophosphotransferase n=1 Tax=Actinomadura viridis TaxID=58110 RepID=A0A931GNX2_9ACTN|nr:CDP-glycerol glycerophosphotransferase family protein [Actinomadura viridis]MBG6086824.1 CDP-glycerol glycerophosphotransferase [Actinomadura viridis]
MRGAPDVSVVVIAYNDAGRLPRAVGSVLGQSMDGVEAIVVDDASTDATGRVADALAAAHPDRVRAVHLPVNSGGCGRPRNTGMDLARGSHVMFLDSDDVLDRHACLNMLLASEETGADLVSGLCVRSFTGPPVWEKGWYARLYRARAVHDSLPDCPDLLYDTLATNKCYRRDFLIENGLRFVEELHYEDLLFTTEAYLAAGRITVLPHRVYTWYVYEEPGRPSISSRRREVRNLADRLEIHRRIDRALGARGADAIKLAKDAKFVNHDLQLYLGELPGRDEEYRRRFLELAGPYLAELHPGALTAARRLPAISAYLVGRGDLDGAVAAMRAAREKVPELHAGLVRRDGRVYWTGRHLDDGRGREILDITELGVHVRPLERVRPAITLTGLHREGRYVRLAGRVADPLGRVPAAGLSGTLELRDRRRDRTLRIPAEAARRGDRIEWRAAFDDRSLPRPPGLGTVRWDVRLALRANGERLSGRVAAGPAGAGPAPAWPAGGRLEPHVTAWGNLSFVDLRGRMARTVAGGRAWRGARRLKREGARVRASARRALTARTTKTAVFNRLLTRLPVRRGTVVFESHLGAQYSDNPKYIYEELRRSGRGARAIWSYAKTSEGFPADATLVRRGSWAYYHALARAEFWVDNQGFPRELRKRKKTTYIQTWHGSAYKRMGFDKAELKNASLRQQERFRRMVERFDCFLVRSAHDERTLVPGLGVTAELLPAGYPRNDPLVRARRGDPEPVRAAEALRRELGLDGDRAVILYAPTFRSRPDGTRIRRAVPPIDPGRFAARLGDSQVLLVRQHYRTRLDLPGGGDGAVRDAGHIADVTPLLLLADALITDHSSVMFDYALLDRPIVLYVPDGEDAADLAAHGGGYFDLAAHAPGPVVRDEEALLTALAGLDRIRREYAWRRRAFAARYGEYDQGAAAEAVVERFFGKAARHG